MKKKVKGKALLYVLVFTVFLTGCAKENKGEEKAEKIDLIEEQSESGEEHDFQGEIEDFTLLERDGLFLLELKNDENIIINQNGEVQDSFKLESDYLDCTGEKTSDEKQVFDIYKHSVQSRFIKDGEHEKIIDVCRMKKQDVVWVSESKETPTSSLIVIKAFDENGKELCSVDSANTGLSEQEAGHFKDITYVEYMGDSICGIYYTMAGTELLFEVNVETGEILHCDGKFSDGYAISDNKIFDIHGNVVKTLSADAARYSEGMFFDRYSKKFYDVNLNEKIDLSNYDILCWNGNIGADGWTEDYAFTDGYCGIEVKNENGTRFYGLIDTQGNWVIELTDTLSQVDDPYIGKITDSKIMLGSRFYDVKTKEFQMRPDILTENKCFLHDGKYYYLDENMIYIYDPDTDCSVEFGGEK